MIRGVKGRIKVRIIFWWGQSEDQSEDRRLVVASYRIVRIQVTIRVRIECEN